MGFTLARQQAAERRLRNMRNRLDVRDSVGGMRRDVEELKRRGVFFEDLQALLFPASGDSEAAPTAASGPFPYDYLVDDSDTGTNGRTELTNHGHIYKIYNNLPDAVADANTNRQTTDQTSTFFIAPGTYTLTASMTVDPPSGGSYLFFGAGRDQTFIVAGANSIIMFDIAGLVGASTVDFKDTNFSNASGTTSVILVQYGSSVRGSISDCWFNVSGTTNYGLQFGNGAIGVMCSDTTFSGNGNGVGGASDLELYINHCIFESGLNIAIDLTNCGKLNITNCVINGMTGIRLTSSSTTMNIVGNFFEVGTIGIDIDTSASGRINIIANHFNGIGSGDVGIDFSNASSAYGVNIDSNFFDIANTGIGIQGDATATIGCRAYNNYFFGVTSGNEITDWDHDENEAAHNYSYSGLGGNEQALADIGSPVGHSPGEGVEGTINTTNATPATLLTIAIPASTTVEIEMSVIARRTGGTAGTAEDAAAYRRIGTYKTVAGVVTLVGALTTIHVVEDQAGWEATLVISGTNVIVQVTGATNNNVSWQGAARVKKVSS